MSEEILIVGGNCSGGTFHSCRAAAFCTTLLKVSYSRSTAFLSLPPLRASQAPDSLRPSGLEPIMAKRLRSRPPPADRRPKNKLLASLPRADFARLRPHLRTVPLAVKQILHPRNE